MKRLNNKGMSIIEIILCFALASLIIISLYNIIDSISSNKRTEETKFILSYQKTEFTKVIMADIIKNGLQSIVVNGNKKPVTKTVVDTPVDLYKKNLASATPSNNCAIFDAKQWLCKNGAYNDTAQESPIMFKSSATSILVISFNFKNGMQKELRILKQIGNYDLPSQPGGGTTKIGDKFYVAYGEPNNIIPTEYRGKNANPYAESGVEIMDFDSFGYAKEGHYKKYETRIGNINISMNAKFLKLDLRFDHPELKQTYGMYFITPTTIDQAYPVDLYN